jgi:hypothetical protein
MMVLRLGLGLTVGVTAIMVLFWGWEALIPGVVFGLLSTGTQLAAHRLLVATKDAPFAQLAQRWLAGMTLRLAGIALVFTAIGLDRELFPPLPTVIGYLGVVIPLLFTEVRLFR